MAQLIMHRSCCFVVSLGRPLRGKSLTWPVALYFADNLFYCFGVTCKNLETAFIPKILSPNNPTALPQWKSHNLGINYPKQSETFLMIFVFGIEKHDKLDTQKTTTSHLLNNND